MMYLDHCLIFRQGPNNCVASEPLHTPGYFRDERE
jgi:hypothetical protein